MEEGVILRDILGVETFPPRDTGARSSYPKAQIEANFSPAYLKNFEVAAHWVRGPRGGSLPLGRVEIKRELGKVRARFIESRDRWRKADGVSGGLRKERRRGLFVASG